MKKVRVVIMNVISEIAVRKGATGKIVKNDGVVWTRPCQS